MLKAALVAALALLPNLAHAGCATILATDDSKVAKTGDAMTGQLTMSGASASIVGQSSVTTSGGFFGDGSHLTGLPSTASISGFYLPLTGGALTGNLTNSADNSARNVAATYGVTGATASFTSALDASSITLHGNAFSVGGSTFVVIASSVGILTASPQGIFHVATPSPFVINGLGNVGIGTTNPGYQLVVPSTATVGSLAITGPNPWTSTAGSLNNGDIICGSNGFSGTRHDCNFTLWNNVDAIRLLSHMEGIGLSKWNQDTANSPPVFIGVDATSNTWFNSGGNVGIGTTGPATKLHMSSGTLLIDGTGAAIGVGSVNTTPGSLLLDNGANDNKILGGIGGVAKINMRDASIGDMTFDSQFGFDFLNSGSNKIKINSSGGVGVGTTVIASSVAVQINSGNLVIGGDKYIVANSSITTSGGFFGDGSHLAGVGGGVSLSANNTWTGTNNFTNDVTMPVYFSSATIPQVTAYVNAGGTSNGVCVAGSTLTITTPFANMSAIINLTGSQNQTTTSRFWASFLLDGAFVSPMTTAIAPTEWISNGLGHGPATLYWYLPALSQGTHKVCLLMWTTGGVGTLQNDAASTNQWVLSVVR